MSKEADAPVTWRELREAIESTLDGATELSVLVAIPDGQSEAFQAQAKRLVDSARKLNTFMGKPVITGLPNV